MNKNKNSAARCEVETGECIHEERDCNIEGANFKVSRRVVNKQYIQ